MQELGPGEDERALSQVISQAEQLLVMPVWWKQNDESSPSAVHHSAQNSSSHRYMKYILFFFSWKPIKLSREHKLFGYLIKLITCLFMLSVFKLMYIMLLAKFSARLQWS